MTLALVPVLDALAAAWSADATLASVPLYVQRAPAGVSYPYAVARIEGEGSYTYAARADELLLTVQLYDTSRASGAIMALASAAVALVERSNWGTPTLHIGARPTLVESRVGLNALSHWEATLVFRLRARALGG